MESGSYEKCGQENGPDWRVAVELELEFIQPGKPTQNAFVESLNGKFHSECLNQHWLRSLDEAHREID